MKKLIIPFLMLFVLTGCNGASGYSYSASVSTPYYPNDNYYTPRPRVYINPQPQYYPRYYSVPIPIPQYYYKDNHHHNNDNHNHYNYQPKQYNRNRNHESHEHRQYDNNRYPQNNKRKHKHD